MTPGDIEAERSYLREACYAPRGAGVDAGYAYERYLALGVELDRMTPTLVDLAAALIAVFEGPERLAAYQDAGGVWTIGQGHTAGVRAGMTITHEESVAFFAADQAPLLAMVAAKPTVQAAAFVSFGFNCGAHALAKVVSGEDTISNPVHTTDRHGDVLQGLVSRRRLEALLAAA